MKTICAGYRDAAGTIMECGKVIKDGDEDGGLSHGLCDQCFEAFKRVIEELRAKGRL